MDLSSPLSKLQKLYQRNNSLYHHLLVLLSQPRLRTSKFENEKKPAKNCEKMFVLKTKGCNNCDDDEL